MVNAARAGQPSPTDEQHIWRMCKAFNCLPSQLTNEDAYYIERMMIYENVYLAIKRRREAFGEGIHELPDYVNDVLDMLDEMGIKYDGIS